MILLEKKCDENVRYILVDCKVNEISLILLNIYCPTKDKPNEQMAFLDENNFFLGNYDEYEIKVDWDLNTYLDDKLDKKVNRIELKSCWNHLAGMVK